MVVIKDMLNHGRVHFIYISEYGDYSLTQLFAPNILRREITQRKNASINKTHFTMSSIIPILANELERNQIIFSNKYCFDKTYPKTIEQQIQVSKQIGTSTYILCQVFENTTFHNPERMKKIIVTDVEKSELSKSKH